MQDFVGARGAPIGGQVASAGGYEIRQGDTLWGLWKKSANQGETWDAFSKRIRQENPQLDLDKPLAIGMRLNGINLA